MLEYYSRRAREYERIYHKPERLPDLAELHERIPRFFVDADVLEIACGTGYWTARIAGAARSIVATDRSPEVLEIARSKQYPKENVRFAIGDAFDLTSLAGTFTAGFGGFWWSHVRREELRGFLGHFHGRLSPGARVLWVDNRYVDGSSTPVSRADAEGNTYQVRMLEDGSTHEVLKNFPSNEELYAAIDDVADDVSLTQLEYYWCLGYRLRPAIP